jgi:hypothetical protein
MSVITSTGPWMVRVAVRFGLIAGVARSLHILRAARRGGRRACIAGVSVLLAVLAPAAVARADGWRLQSVAADSSAAESTLSGVACPGTVGFAYSTSSPCYAVGYEASASGPAVALIEKWTGSSWIVWNSGGPPGSGSSELFGVSCPYGGTFCMAVGQYASNGHTFPLVYTWDASSGPVAQLTVPSDSPYGNYFNSVSCQSSSFCVLVGPILNDVWNGSTFTPESSPINTGLSPFYVGVWLSVSCATAQPGFCTEVGFQPALHDTNAPVAESYVNGQWIVQTNDYSGKFVVGPSNARSSTLTGVSCITGQSCQAVGIY